jgi:hypothetical protein
MPSMLFFNEINPPISIGIPTKAGIAAVTLCFDAPIDSHAKYPTPPRMIRAAAQMKQMFRMAGC